MANPIFKCVICEAEFRRYGKSARTTAKCCSRSCLGQLNRLMRSGPDSPFWKGGRFVNERGYVLLYAPDHPHPVAGRYQYEHRLVMEQSLGRYLDPIEVVHHRDENPGNNSLENLELLSSQVDHASLHTKWRWDHDPQYREEQRQRNIRRKDPGTGQFRRRSSSR